MKVNKVIWTPMLLLSLLTSNMCLAGVTPFTEEQLANGREARAAVNAARDARLGITRTFNAAAGQEAALYSASQEAIALRAAQLAESALETAREAVQRFANARAIPSNASIVELRILHDEAISIRNQLQGVAGYEAQAAAAEARLQQILAQASQRSAQAVASSSTTEAALQEAAAREIQIIESAGRNATPLQVARLSRLRVLVTLTGYAVWAYIATEAAWWVGTQIGTLIHENIQSFEWFIFLRDAGFGALEDFPVYRPHQYVHDGREILFSQPDGSFVGENGARVDRDGNYIDVYGVVWRMPRSGQGAGSSRMGPFNPNDESISFTPARNPDGTIRTDENGIAFNDANEAVVAIGHQCTNDCPVETEDIEDNDAGDGYVFADVNGDGVEELVPITPAATLAQGTETVPFTEFVGVVDVSLYPYAMQAGILLVDLQAMSPALREQLETYLRILANTVPTPEELREERVQANLQQAWDDAHAFVALNAPRSAMNFNAATANMARDLFNDFDVTSQAHGAAAGDALVAAAIARITQMSEDAFRDGER